MIPRHEEANEPTLDVWRRLAAPVDLSDIAWRQDGRPLAKDGRFFARFVCYIEATTVRERLDAVVPGEWNLTLEPLPTIVADGDGVEERTPFAFKARLQILGVVREDVGTGKDYKQASTDAFKRVAVRFGIGHELYAFEQNWVPMDGDGKYAKPLEDPAIVYGRRYGAQVGGTGHPGPVAVRQEAPASPAAAPYTARQAGTAGEPTCPKCGGQMWSNVLENNQRAARGEKLRPDHKCKNRSCDGVIWRPKQEAPAGVSESDGPPPWDDAGPVPF